MPGGVTEVGSLSWEPRCGVRGSGEGGGDAGGLGEVAGEEKAAGIFHGLTRGCRHAVGVCARCVCCVIGGCVSDAELWVGVWGCCWGTGGAAGLWGACVGLLLSWRSPGSTVLSSLLSTIKP